VSSIGRDRHRAEQRAGARFPAKFPGRCVSCDEGIEVGQMLRWGDAGAIHADCDDIEIPGHAETTEVCGACFLAISVSGECGCES